MSVIVGSARINEKGKVNGGAAGDQNGLEVSTQVWYLHSKGWMVIRAKDPAVREMVAHNMESICANNNIGYCQDHRGTLTAAAKPYGYDAAKVEKKVEVDCSEAVRNCVLYAGINVGSFTTANEVSVLKATGRFEVLKEDKYCRSSDYLLRGDILCTKTKGHTVVVLSDGVKVSGSSDNMAGVGAGKYTVGDIVQFTGCRHYANANAATGKSCKPGKAKVTQVYQLGKSKHPYHLRAISGCGSNVCGWVNEEDIQDQGTGSTSTGKADAASIQVGDIVQYSGCIHYISSYAGSKGTACKPGRAKVTAVSVGKAHPFHLVNTETGSTVHGWVDADKVSK